jgi:hypothetical protein
MPKSASVPYPKVTRPLSHKLFLVHEAKKHAINGIETSNLFEESIIINPNNLRLDTITDTVTGNLFEESIIINPKNLRLEAINDTVTGNLFEESIIINPNNLRLDENPKDADPLGKGSVEIKTFVENTPSEKMKAEADRMKTGFSICASVLFATLCIFFATSKLSFVANLLHMSAALAIHLSAISLVLLSDENL